MTRRLGGGGGGDDTGIFRRDPKKHPTTRPHWGPGGRLGGAKQHEPEGADDRKVRLSWRERSMRRGELSGRRGQLRRR